MLLNFMKIDEGWSFVWYLRCHSLSLLCTDFYYYPPTSRRMESVYCDWRGEIFSYL